MSFQTVTKFENEIAKFYGSKFAVAVDCCTHAIELCLRYTQADDITIPSRTYISIPFLAEKLNLKWAWREEDWEDYYYLGNTNIIDGAVLWKKESYIPESLMCVSFQYQKHLSLGRGGMILTDDSYAATNLRKMAYDGRDPLTPWRDQNISSMGYHYYMTPETAQLGLDKLETAKDTPPRQWVITDWPDLKHMDIFKNSVL